MTAIGSGWRSFRASNRRSAGSRLIDGTRIHVAAEKVPTGDPIQTTLKIDGEEVEVDALGVVGIRLDGKGQLEAVAAGELKHLRAGRTQVKLPSRADLAL
jgi:hypothetical protein